MPSQRIYRHIAILTGAGISAESGVDTFRTKGGLWEQYDVNEVATIEAFRRNPEKVHAFYNMRRGTVRHVEPNAAHFALAKLEAEFPGTVTIITQNVDSLHEKAGSKGIYHMHGQHGQVWCMACDDRYPWTDELSTSTVCPNCGAVGHVRPDVVWFGEMPYYLDEIDAVLRDADLFVSIGTSGNVYPAAGFVSMVRRLGVAHTMELNLEPSEGAQFFHESRHGPATEVVPAFVEEVLAAEA